MFKVIPNGINRLDIELSGKLNTEEMKIALDELLSKSKDIKNGKMLYEICKNVNPNSHFISSSEEVEKEMILGFKTLGISGATSTPTWLLKDVANKVSSFRK